MYINTFQHVKSYTHLQSSDSTLLMMSARSKGRGMLGSSTPQKGRSTGASSGGNVWARLEWHLRRQNTGNKKKSHLLLPPVKAQVGRDSSPKGHVSPHSQNFLHVFIFYIYICILLQLAKARLSPESFMRCVYK